MERYGRDFNRARPEHPARMFRGGYDLGYQDLPYYQEGRSSGRLADGADYDTDYRAEPYEPTPDLSSRRDWSSWEARYDDDLDDWSRPGWNRFRTDNPDSRWDRGGAGGRR